MSNEAAIRGVRIAGRKVYCWGAGSSGDAFVRAHRDVLSGVVDSNPGRGREISGIPVQGPSVLFREDPEATLLFIASSYFPEIRSVVEARGYRMGKNCFLAVETTEDRLVARGYIDEAGLGDFFSRLELACADRSERFVVLRDPIPKDNFDYHRDIDILIDAGLVPSALELVDAEHVDEHQIQIDLLIHEPLSSSDIPNYFRPLAEAGLSSVGPENRRLQPELEALFLAYHMLFHNGPETYVRLGHHRLAQLKRLLQLDEQTEDWVGPATEALETHGFFPPPYLRKKMLEDKKRLGADASWLQSTLQDQQDGASSLGAVIVRDETSNVSAIVRDVLDRSGALIIERYSMTQNACDRIRAGMWHQGERAILPCCGWVLEVNQHKTLQGVEQAQSDMLNRFWDDTSIAVRDALLAGGYPSHRVYIPVGADEIGESVASLRQFGSIL